jgi:MYXO-CTERM domain-containing protein
VRTLARSVLPLLAALAMGGRAEAYVRYVTQDGRGFAWSGTDCLPIIAYPHAFHDMSADEVSTAAMGAAAAWSASQNPCTYLTLEMTLAAADGAFVVPARQPALVFREDRWCKLVADGTCSTKPGENAMYDSSVLMLTSVAVNNKTGVLLEGATEVNGVDFSWADLALHPEALRDNPNLQDLQNGLTHELGHFIGLDHSCLPPGLEPRPLDNQGHPAPACDTASAALMETTMFPTAPPGDLQKRTLAPDDQQGLCDIYPLAADPGQCVPPGGTAGCGCALADGPGAASLTLPLLGGLALLARRRRGRRPRSFATASPLC